jgi:DNA processing protein
MLSTLHILTLGFLPGITSTALRGLVESGVPFREIVQAPPEDLASVGLRRQTIESLSNIVPYLERATRQIETAEKHEASIVHYWNDAYPERLRQIYSPPSALYVKGTLTEEDGRAIAIVGTRSASVYGRLAAERYAEEFVTAGITVVSGLARGIDTYAHAAALKAGGRTIAVIASGLDEIAPTYAAQLAERITDNGAVVTEYPFGVKALPAYFPQRNRIISGMTTATTVVESDERGGAMITAGFARDQGRELFAVPGPIYSPKSRGTNLLIRTDRARLTQAPADMLDSLGYHITAAHTVGNVPRPGELNAFEQRIYEALDGEPRHVDTICETTGLAASEVLVNLLSLEFKGLARQLAGKMFVRA